MTGLFLVEMLVGRDLRIPLDLFRGCSSDWKEKEVPYVYMWVEL